ncbi:neuropeptide CCHamide-1 receptor-like [Ostrea edulis]|uniref:neuropeptide CCHamide-1 receptor-like n=1 Tax=Ostrea edulis TaxID=37623 RepID=UPI002094C065|nr:neuropeptide CCHamide-1 receptor-like [Ostrea edulis]
MNNSSIVMQSDSHENGSFDLVQMELFAKRPETFAIIVICSVIFVAGILGNIALLTYVICRNRLTSPHNIYSTNLAIGDILTLTIAMPFLSSIYTMTYWPFGDSLCKFSECIHTLSISITVFMISALSVERYRMLKLHSPSLNVTSSSVISFILWLVAAMLAIPDLVSAETMSYRDLHYCRPYRENWGETYAKTLVIIKFTCIFALPLLIIAVCYSLIGYNLFSKRSRFHSCYYDENQTVLEEEMRKHSKRKSMAVLVFGLVIVFIVTWLPRHVYLMWYYFDPSPYDLTWHIVKIVGVCLMFCNAALNPLVFFCFDARFRECCCCRKSRDDLDGYAEIPDNTVVLTETAHDTVVLTNVNHADSDTRV